jgi:thiol-disulfide isomerase/thioredoxin
MLVRILYLITTALFSLSGQAQSYNDIALQQFDTADQVTLGSLDPDKPIYLKMWATWCKPCMEQMPHFSKLQHKFADKVNIIAVNININEDSNKIAEVIKRYGLTMPVWLDNEGQLGVALGLTGTPYSVLINTDGKVVYSTHESDDKLDRFISMLAKGQKLQNATTDVISTQQKQVLLQPWQQGEHLLFFTATWCDWYLLDSRPEMASKCKQAQMGLNALQQRLPAQPWHGVVNHLWTDQQALQDFTTQYNMQLPFSIDTAGVLFNAFNIRSIPTLLKLKDGKILIRVTDFTDEDVVVQQLSGQ